MKKIIVFSAAAAVLVVGVGKAYALPSVPTIPSAPSKVERPLLSEPTSQPTTAPQPTQVQSATPTLGTGGPSNPTPTNKPGESTPDDDSGSSSSNDSGQGGESNVSTLSKTSGDQSVENMMLMLGLTMIIAGAKVLWMKEKKQRA